MPEKMLKSAGNVVRPEEVVRGVFHLRPGFSFLDVGLQVVDFVATGVYRDFDGFFYTSQRHGKRPVFLAYDGAIVEFPSGIQHPNVFVVA